MGQLDCFDTLDSLDARRRSRARICNSRRLGWMVGAFAAVFWMMAGAQSGLAQDMPFEPGSGAGVEVGPPTDLGDGFDVRPREFNENGDDGSLGPGAGSKGDKPNAGGGGGSQGRGCPYRGQTLDLIA